MIRQTVGDGGEINILNSVMSKPYYSILCRKIIFSNCTVPVRFGDRQSNEIFLLNPGSFPLLVYQLLPHCVSLQVRKVETIVTKCYFER